MASASRSTAPITFSDLPLFADDHEIARACVGNNGERIAEWLGKLPALEQCGFPKRSRLYNLRYTPAVREYYDREFLAPRLEVGSPGDEGGERWNGRRSRRLG